MHASACFAIAFSSDNIDTVSRDAVVQHANGLYGF